MTPAPALNQPLKKTRRRFCDGTWHCADCGTSSTPVRRNSPLTGIRSVCNACGLRRSKALRAARPAPPTPPALRLSPSAAPAAPPAAPPAAYDIDYPYASPPCLSDWSGSASSADGVSSVHGVSSPPPNSADILLATAAAAAIAPPPPPPAQVCPLDEMLWGGAGARGAPVAQTVAQNTASLETLLGEMEGDAGMLGAALDFRSFGGVAAVDAPFYV